MHMRYFLEGFNDSSRNIPFYFEQYYLRSPINLFIGACFPPDYIRKTRAFSVSEEEGLKIFEEAEDFVMWQGNFYPFGHFIFWNGRAMEVGSERFLRFISKIEETIRKQEKKNALL